MEGFKKFLLRGNVVDLAVAVVIAVAFTAIVAAFVKGVVTPFIGMFGGIPDFATWTITINGSKFLVGEFLNAVVSFVIVAAILYFLVILPVNRILEMQDKGEPLAKECPECLSKIPQAAKRCRYCASPQAVNA